MRRHAIVVVPGDGIGPEVTREALKVLEAVEASGLCGVDATVRDWGAERYLRTGETLPPEGLEEFRRASAVFMGAFGDPRVPDMRHAADILLGTRFKLDLYVNERPVRVLADRLCPLKDVPADSISFTVFRENTEGLYVGIGGQFKRGTSDEVAVQEDVNTRKGVERIIRHAFQFARERRLTRVCMSDKSNVLRFGHDLWQRVFAEVAEEYPEIEREHLYVDALVMQLVRRPQSFQVIVTCNMFGDIVTDLGAALQGGLGMAASGNVHPGAAAMFEPVHGSAPKYAGQGIANPFGAVLTAAMMLEHLGESAAARAVEGAVAEAVRTEQCTRDLGGALGTEAAGSFVAERVRRGDQ
jgi:3-isopropylmalate dehydrogenase